MDPLIATLTILAIVVQLVLTLTVVAMQFELRRTISTLYHQGVALMATANAQVLAFLTDIKASIVDLAAAQAADTAATQRIADDVDKLLAGAADNGLPQSTLDALQGISDAAKQSVDFGQRQAASLNAIADKAEAVPAPPA